MKYEPDNVIVAVDNGKVCGCIVGSTDSKKFTDKMKTEFLPKVARVSRIWALFFRFCIRTNDKWDNRGGYGFHINIASGHQGKKIGTNLMQKAAENAKSKHKKFMYLVTANRKTVGYSFYMKLGFKDTKHLFGGSIFMTLDL
ncbi:MAG: GNAT family N-acetyltransferase [Clostridia bacterium]|nr:GNAT family N-acetyltransferase [Clostridia bacterium]